MSSTPDENQKSVVSSTHPLKSWSLPLASLLATKDSFAQSLHHSLWIMLGKVGSFFIPFSALNFLMLVGFVTIVAIHGSYDFRDICQHAGPLLHRCLCFLRNKTIHWSKLMSLMDSSSCITRWTLPGGLVRKLKLTLYFSRGARNQQNGLRGLQRNKFKKT